MTFDLWGQTFLADHIGWVLLGLPLLVTATVFTLRRLLPRRAPLTYLLGPFEWAVEVVAVLFILYKFGVLDLENPVQETLALPVGGGLFLSLAVIAGRRFIQYRVAVAGYLDTLARSKAIRIAVILGVAHFASWWWYGRYRVYQSVPSMSEAVMDLYQRRARHLGYAVNGKRPPLNLVVCKQMSAELGTGGVARLQTRLKPYGVSLFTEDSAPRSFLANRWKCDGCQVFCAETRFNSPVLAVVETETWWGSLGANGFTNVSVFLLGRCFRIATWQSWVA